MKVFNLLTACAVAAPLLLAGCSDDSVGDIDVPGVVDGPVTFTVGMGVVTQAPPVSRASELAHEPGFEYENAIEDAVVIIYTQPLNTYGGEIVYSKYLSGDQLTKDASFTGARFSSVSYDAGGNATAMSTEYSSVNRYELKFETNLTDGQTYYIIALANVGDLVGAGAGNARISSLDDLRNYVYNGDICTSADYSGDCGRFAMSAIGEERFVYNKSALNNNTYTLPELHVQRLAARIDLVFGNQGWTKEDLAGNSYDYVILNSGSGYPFDSYNTSVFFPIYDAETGSRISGAVLALDKLQICNAVTGVTGQYLLERNLAQIFGTENFDASTGYAGNLVLSPGYDNANKSVSDYAAVDAKAFFGRKFYDATKGTDTYKYGVLGYVRENTFRNYSAANAYTAISFTGHTNLSAGHFEGATTDADHYGVSGMIPVRHSTGELDTTRPLAYGIVRNTIYRIRIRFYAKGETISARYYYYGTYFDGKEDKNNLGEKKYTDIPFYSYILEGDGTQPND